MADLHAVESDTAFREWAARAPGARRSPARTAKLIEGVAGPTAAHRFPTVTVVGSKGKGTAAAWATATLAHQGMSVVTVFSPGMTDNRDRVRVNGQSLSEAEYLKLITQVGAALDQMSPAAKDEYLSPYGFYLAAALLVAHQQEVDALVVEAGIGGASDDSAVLHSSVVALTSVFEEHLEELGPTVRDLVLDKIGIATAATTHVVTGLLAPELAPVVAQHCEEVGAQLQTDPVSHWRASDVALPPGLNASSAAVGIEAGLALLKNIRRDEPVDLASLRSLKVNYPGRLTLTETRGGQLLTDAAISRAGLVAALSWSRRFFGDFPDKVFVAIPDSKDFDGFTSELARNRSQVIFVTMPSSHLPFERAANSGFHTLTLAQALDQMGVGNVLAVGTATFISEVVGTYVPGARRLF